MNKITNSQIMNNKEMIKIKKTLMICKLKKKLHKKIQNNLKLQKSIIIIKN